jgi:uncharacterized protein
MGGFDAAMLGDDRRLAGYVLISAADIGVMAARPGFATASADEISYTNASAANLAADARAHATEWDWSRRTALMAGRPVLILTSDDGFAATGNAAAAAIETVGGPKPTLIHMATDHSFDDQRVALAARIVQWLEASFSPK